MALTQAFDHFEEAALFHRSVFGLTLEAAVVRRGEWGPAVPEPQHVAFACTDAPAAAMRAAGAPLPDMPATAYEARLAALRERSVLYDGDARGEFLHFYPALAGGAGAADRARRPVVPPVKTPA